MRSFVQRLAVAIYMSSVVAPAQSEIIGVQKGAFAADGTRLTALGKLPGDAVVVVDGQRTTAGKLRDELHALALRHLGKPTIYIPSSKVPNLRAVPRVPDQSVYAALSSPSPSPTPDFHLKFARPDYLPASAPTPAPAASGARLKLGRAPLPEITPAPPSPTPGVRPISGDDRPDPNFCHTHAPIIQHVKGSVTPGGYVVVEGLCFGASSKIALHGTFPGGPLPLTVQSWSDTAVTAAIPQVSGVYDQKVKVQITGAREPSNEVELAFTATRVILQLPSRFITNVSCSAGANQSPNASQTCSGASASHWQEDAGTDTWQAQLPQGWTLTSLEMSTGIGTIPGTAGFFQQPPSAETWSVSWQSGFAGTTFQDTIVWGIFISSTTVDLTAASYSMTLYAIGPAGTMPQ